MDHPTLADLTVTTTSGEVFIGLDSARMAALIYRRFGRDLSLALAKWREMLGNSASERQFANLVLYGLAMENILHRPDFASLYESDFADVLTREAIRVMAKDATFRARLPNLAPSLRYHDVRNSGAARSNGADG